MITEGPGARATASQQTNRFFSLWTLKEAYVKARGIGRGESPSAIRF